MRLGSWEEYLPWLGSGEQAPGFRSGEEMGQVGAGGSSAWLGLCLSSLSHEVQMASLQQSSSQSLL